MNGSPCPASIHQGSSHACHHLRIPHSPGDSRKAQPQEYTHTLNTPFAPSWASFKKSGAPRPVRLPWRSGLGSSPSSLTRSASWAWRIPFMPSPPGLHVLHRACGATPTGFCADGLQISSGSGKQKMVLVASVPLTSETWRPLNEGEVLALRGGRIAHSSSR